MTEGETYIAWFVRDVLPAVNIRSKASVKFTIFLGRYSSQTKRYNLSNFKGSVQIQLSTCFGRKMNEESDLVTMETSRGTNKARVVNNCAGLPCDYVAAATGYKTD
jgi:L-2-hydroxyglutarate oxidase LhgO